MFLNFLFLPIIFFIGFITSYQDFKFGKIKNKWIFLGLIWGLGVYFVLSFLIFLSHYLPFLSAANSYIAYPYVARVFLNVLISLLVGYAFWYLDLWSAGDAKLFVVFALLLPLTYYWRSYLPYFPSFAFLINIFIPALGFLLAQNLILIVKNIKLQPVILKNIFSFLSKVKKYLKNHYLVLLKSLLTFILMFLSFQIFYQAIISRTNQLLAPWVFVLLLGASKVFRGCLKKTYALVTSFLIFIVCIAVNGFSGMGQIFITAKGSLPFFIVFPIVSLIFSYNRKKLPQPNIPFAIWLFIGIIITIILKGSLISFLLDPQAF